MLQTPGGVYLPGPVGPPGPLPQVVTVLPTGGSDKQLIVYETPLFGVYWLLRFVAAINRWVYLGGPPRDGTTATSQTTASATFTDLATVGPSVTAPAAGSYDVQWGATISNNTVNTASFMGVKVGTTEPTDANSIQHTESSAGAAAVAETVMGRRRVTAAALDAIVARYRAASGTATFSARWLTITPVFLDAV
jgi:hypothetical protein